MMTKAEFDEKWKEPPLFPEDFDMMFEDAENAGLIKYECIINGCTFSTTNRLENKLHSDTANHKIQHVTILKSWKKT